MKEKVLEELQLSVGIVLGGEEVVPRFRVICADGDWTIFVPLPDDIGEASTEGGGLTCEMCTIRQLSWFSRFTCCRMASYSF